MHPVISGAYYYSSLFSILTPVIIVLLFSRGRKQEENILGKAVIVVFMAIQLVNFYDLNSRWKLFHENWIYLESSQKFPYLLKSAELIDNEKWLGKSGLLVDYKNKNGLDTLDSPKEHEKRIKNLWTEWKKRENVNLESDMNGFTNRDALFLHEMDVLVNNKK
jgi:hypothetical protein